MSTTQKSTFLILLLLTLLASGLMITMAAAAPAADAPGSVLEEPKAFDSGHANSITNERPANLKPEKVSFLDRISDLPGAINDLASNLWEGAKNLPGDLWDGVSSAYAAAENLIDAIPLPNWVKGAVVGIVVGAIAVAIVVVTLPVSGPLLIATGVGAVVGGTVAGFAMGDGPFNLGTALLGSGIGAVAGYLSYSVASAKVLFGVTKASANALIAVKSVIGGVISMGYETAMTGLLEGRLPTPAEMAIAFGLGAAFMAIAAAGPIANGFGRGLDPAVRSFAGHLRRFLPAKWAWAASSFILEFFWKGTQAVANEAIVDGTGSGEDDDDS